MPPCPSFLKPLSPADLCLGFHHLPSSWDVFRPTCSCSQSDTKNEVRQSLRARDLSYTAHIVYSMLLIKRCTLVPASDFVIPVTQAKSMCIFFSKSDKVTSPCHHLRRNHLIPVLRRTLFPSIRIVKRPSRCAALAEMKFAKGTYHSCIPPTTLGVHARFRNLETNGH